MYLPPLLPVTKINIRNTRIITTVKPVYEKKIMFSLLGIVYIFFTQAQAPNAIPFQGVARNTSGNIIASQPVSIRFTIHNTTTTGTILYRETHTVTTTSLGLFSINIGNGTPGTGTFAAINWASGLKYLQVEMDPAGGSSYTDMGTQQMLSVPYSLLSGKSSDVPTGTAGGNTMRWNGTAWVATNNLANTGSNVGVGTATPNNSAILELSSTTQGLLLPRMTSVQREAIASPAIGLMIYNLDNNCIEVRGASSWISFCSNVCTPIPTTSNAGPDQNPSSGAVTLAANTPAFGTGNWSIIGGSGGSFVSNSNPTTQFTGTQGPYQLRWSITTACGTSTDDVYISYPCAANMADCNGLASDGCETNLFTNVAHCGSCAITCVNAYPNAVSACVAGSCTLQSCSPGFYDLDGNPANGCEYACAFSSSTDLPDDLFNDSNCDGIDGNASLAIFVSATTGNNSNPGTKALPKQTITAGIGAAVSAGKTQVYISAGTYTESITLSNGISLYGGYSASNSWSRSAANIVNVTSSSNPGISGTSITIATTIDRINVTTSNNPVAGGSNYGVNCSGCTNLTIRYCTIIAGNGGPGSGGNNGSTGAAGSNGGAGGQGSCDGNGSGGAGGTAGFSSCGRTGGAGGIGGGTSGFGSQNGTAGSGGTGGAVPGSGGGTGNPGVGGGSGNSGVAATAGTNGGGGSGGSVVSNIWITSQGSNGTNGGNGNGGAGGGGGGSQTGTFIDDGFGNGGGGGGGGGCGGTAGTAGNGGGGSFGIFLVNSTGITLSNNTINSGSGGNGGSGGSGAPGGIGGSGGSGG